MPRVPGRLRKVLDWVVTIGVALLLVLVFEAEVAKPYRIPSSSMEPTLHCAKPGAWCEGRFNDRVIANRLSYRFASPKRGQIVVFHAPSTACGIGGTFVKRLIGLPGDTVSERNGYVSINGKPLHEPYVDPKLRDRSRTRGRCLPAGTSSWATTECTPATPACGEPCPSRASSGPCCSPTGRRPAGSEVHEAP